MCVLKNPLMQIPKMAGEILPPVDSEISAMLRAEYTKQGIDFFVGSRVSRLDDKKVMRCLIVWLIVGDHWQLN